MTNTIAHTVSMLEMLPAQEQDFAMGSGLYKTYPGRTFPPGSRRTGGIYKRKGY